ncbi:MAG: Zn-dependent alcohol dehydrogenase [Alphaproteobacteria bacterium]
MMQVEAAVMYAVGEPLVVESLELEAPRAGEVLVKIGASGVCHSDYHVVSGQSGHDLPVVLGHEGAGTIVAVGDGVGELAPGDHVVLSWIPFCGECFFCTHEQTHLCKAYIGPLWAGTMTDGSNRLSKDGQPVRQLSMLATWADHAVVPAVSCVKIAPSIPFEVGALLGCAVTTGVGAVLNRAKVEPGSSVAIIGAGGVGLSLIMGARFAMAGRIIVFDVSLEKQALAIEMGATDFVVSSDNSIETVRDMTDGLGADYVFEAVGLVPLQEMALEMVRPGGQVVFVGMAGNDECMSLSAASITRDEKLVSGSMFGSARTDRDFNLYADSYEQGLLPVDQLVTRRYGLSDINEAIDAMLGGMPGRGVIVFDAGDDA